MAGVGSTSSTTPTTSAAKSRSNLLIGFLGVLIVWNLYWQFTFKVPNEHELSSLAETLLGGKSSTFSSSSSSSSLSEKALATASESTSKDELDEENVDSSISHAVAGLDCKPHGGPDRPEDIAEMVYWKDLPSDAHFLPPMLQQGQEHVRSLANGSNASTSTTTKAVKRYLTFEPDEGGWNNIRMSLETAVTLAIATGRTLVMPPSTQMYLLWHKTKEQEGSQKKVDMNFDDFYHFDAVAAEHAGMEVISFETFLQREALTGQLLDNKTGKPSFPPDQNRTDWNGEMNNWESARKGLGKNLWTWVREVTNVLDWDFNKCVAGIPSEPGPEGVARMMGYLYTSVTEEIFYPQAPGRRRWKTRVLNLTGHPTPVDAPPAARLSELLTERRQMCIYDEVLQDAKVIHVRGEQTSGFRMLVHFYAFIFFEDWRQELWTKRFVRDHIRYVDEIQCAAARIVKELRAIARDNGDPTGGFDTFHIRRGDFQYKQMHLTAEEIYQNNTKDMLEDGRTVFIATDERRADFFWPLKKHYNVRFLSDFSHLTGDLNPNYYGMLDQTIASRGDSFVGVYCSTFTGYINRMRGYHTQKEKGAKRNLNGTVASFYYTPDNMADKRRILHDEFKPLDPPYWAMEFPTAWRDIDHGVPGEGDDYDR